MLFDEDWMNPIFDLVEKTRGLKQREDYHPEIYVFNHSVQCMEWAFRESYDTDLILAALLHDIGKLTNSHGHEKEAIPMIQDHTSAKTCWLVEQHMRIWYLILGEMKKKSKIAELINHPWLPDLLMLARWDKLSRNPNKIPKLDRGKIIEKLNKCIEIHFEINEERKNGN